MMHHQVSVVAHHTCQTPRANQMLCIIRPTMLPFMERLRMDDIVRWTRTGSHSHAQFRLYDRTLRGIQIPHGAFTSNAGGDYYEFGRICSVQLSAHVEVFDAYLTYSQPIEIR